MFNSQSQFTIKAVKNKKFDDSCLINETFNTGDIADCLEHCLEDCRCQSFQICGETKCQLCSSHKQEDSSLLHDNDICVFAMYEMRHAQKFDDHCSIIACPTKYNCCQQQSGLCPVNKRCKPFNSPQKPWKRFTCECRDGYHGDNCDKPVRSCGGYLNHPRTSGMYKVLDSVNRPYEVYCHFDSDGAWTLVQSCSFANHTVENSVFGKPLSEDHPFSENTLKWSGYRLSQTRMLFINQNSDRLRFTCGFEKEQDVNQTDYLQMSLNQLGSNTDITTKYFTKIEVSYRGKINGTDLNGCQIKVGQKADKGLRVRIESDGALFVPEKPNARNCHSFRYFSDLTGKQCLLPTHRCTQNENSTSQLWFGKKP
ncbi:Hypothetical predicted protein [Paramuricea clavata]|uniref:Uncharacterized protein n=1 Tax=Paramuricea clavata TaxID=317549 RepID=A0A6S7JZI6_PARCT|nr:Hypothetical predicted protein [Paramuricea clavata]